MKLDKKDILTNNIPKKGCQINLPVHIPLILSHVHISTGFHKIHGKFGASNDINIQLCS